MTDLSLMFCVVYISCVLGMFFKFLESRIKGVFLIITLVMPILLLFNHFIFSIKYLFIGKFKMSLKELLFPIISYPIAIIFLVELILENKAFYSVNPECKNNISLFIKKYNSIEYRG